MQHTNRVHKEFYELTDPSHIYLLLLSFYHISYLHKDECMIIHNYTYHKSRIQLTLKYKYNYNNIMLYMYYTM